MASRRAIRSIIASSGSPLVKTSSNELALENGVMKMTVYDSRAITASLANGTFILNNQQ